MIKAINDIWSSFNNYEKGASARKLSAFALMVLIAYAHYKYLDISNVVEVIIIDLCGVLILLGLVTAQNILDYKKQSNETIK